MLFAYPATVTPEADTFIVRFRDLPEAITEGASRSEALEQAEDCLDVALLFRVKEGGLPPAASPASADEIVVPPSPAVAAKLAFIRAFQASGETRVGFAVRLGLNENEVRRMLDPDHATKVNRLSEGLHALGRGLAFVEIDLDQQAA